MDHAHTASEVQSGGAQTTGTSFTSGVKTDGTWYFHLAAKDNAGNVSNVSSYTTCIDTVKPTISGVSSGSVTNSSAVISWSTNEASDSLVEYSIDSGSSGDFTFTTASDNDTTKPVITAITTTGVTTSSATVTWTTDEVATSQIEYGTTTSYGSSTTTTTATPNVPPVPPD